MGYSVHAPEMEQNRVTVFFPLVRGAVKAEIKDMKEDSTPPKGRREVSDLNYDMHFENRNWWHNTAATAEAAT